MGKSEHYACALDVASKRVHDNAAQRRDRAAHDETALRIVFTALAEHGRVLAVVDQPASVGAVAVARSMGIDVVYLPGLPMRRIADLHPGPGQDRRPRRPT